MMIIEDFEVSVTLGKIPSLNKFYAGNHWIVRKKFKDEFRNQTLEQLHQSDHFCFEECVVHMRSNYRYDVDNTIMGVKFALDGLRHWGGIPDDTPKYVKKIVLEHDPEVEKDTAVVTFKGKAKILL